MLYLNFLKGKYNVLYIYGTPNCKNHYRIHENLKSPSLKNVHLTPQDPTRSLSMLSSFFDIVIMSSDKKFFIVSNLLVPSREWIMVIDHRREKHGLTATLCM